MTLSNRDILTGKYSANDITMEFRIRLAVWYARRKGYKADLGGWLRRPDGTHICQGYYELYRRIKTMQRGLEEALTLYRCEQVDIEAGRVLPGRAGRQ